MSKKFAAIFVAFLMLLSVFTVITPVSAATPEGVKVFLRPGVEDPYHAGWSQTLGTLWNSPEEVIDNYLDYAIIADGVGDLQFDITLDSPYTGAIYIWIPPEFQFLKPDGTPTTDSAEMRYNVWTDITNDYNYISVGVRSGWDAIAGGWSRIVIGFSRWNPDDDPLSYDGVTFEPGTYHIRVFNLKAPSVAGVYHFKMRLYPDYFDPQDWPIMIVKTELNPAYVIGTVGLCGDLPCSFTPTDKYGKVMAEGTTPEGRSVSAAYWFGPPDTLLNPGVYTYYLFGVAPGTYTLSASAGGYPKSQGERFTVTAGQSMHLKTHWLLGGPSVELTVWSKHGRGELPWGSLWQPPYGTNDPTVLDLGKPRPISFDLYNAETGDHLVWGSPWGTTPTDPLSTSYTWNIGADITWDVHVPAPAGEGGNIDGFTGGVTYKVEAWVTGYVMTDEDAWQREFTVSGPTHVEMDLRRSNWFAITIHEMPLPSVPTTLVLAAEQDGVEKGVTSLLVDTNGDLLFWDSPVFKPWDNSYGPQVNPNTGLPYNINTDPIILEGWSKRYLYTQYEESLDYRDYGLVPGTYDIAMYMADMGDPTGAWYGTREVVGNGWYTIREGDAYSGTIALCVSPSAISFRVRVSSLYVTIRSVDWEKPAHPRPWTFPGAEIGIDILDEEGNVAESLDNALWGVVQDDGSIGSFYAYWDDDPVYPPCLGCVPPVFDTELTVAFTGNDPGVPYGYGPDGGLPIDNIGYYPTHLAPAQYSYSIHTYGYVERRVFPNVLTLGGKADIQVDLIQAGQIRVYLDFYKEHVWIGDILDPWVRVEVFNENDELVGASIYGMADPNPLALAYGMLGYEPYDPPVDWKLVSGEPAEGAGSDAAPEFGYGQRAYTSLYFWGVPSTTYAGYPYLNPINAHRLAVPPGGTAAFDVYGFYLYFGDACSRNEGLWANAFDTTSGTRQTDTGLRGSRDRPEVDGGGLYKVKVWAFDPLRWESFYMASEVAGVEVPWGGSVSVFVDLEQMGRLSGYAAWSDMYGNVRNIPWLQVTATGEGATVFASATPMYADYVAPEWPTELILEPAYFLWVMPGSYDVSAAVPGAEASFSAPSMPTQSIAAGFDASLDIGMEPTGVPIPEFLTAPLVALAALAASLYVLRRRRK